MPTHLSVFKLEDALLAALSRQWQSGIDHWDDDFGLIDGVSPDALARVVIDELTTLAKNDLATVAGAIGLVRVHSAECSAGTDKSPCGCGWFPTS